MSQVKEKTAPLEQRGVKNVANDKLGLRYATLRCKNQPVDRPDCIDYTVCSTTEEGGADANDPWGEIRVDRHSEKVIITGVIELVKTRGAIRISPRQIGPIKFSTETDAIQALRLVREFQGKGA